MLALYFFMGNKKFFSSKIILSSYVIYMEVYHEKEC